MRTFFLIGLLSLTRCIGTDHVDDPIVGELIIVSHHQIALMPAQTQVINAEYFDPYGIMRSVPLSWTSSNTNVAEVDPSGLVIAKAPGQSVVQVSYQNFLGPLVNVNVVENETAVATVTIASEVTHLDIGGQAILSLVVRNINGDVIEGKTAEWFSENSSILTVNAEGTVVAVGNGVAAVHAKVEGVKSNSIIFMVGGDIRTGTFVPAGGYQAAGIAMLNIVNNQLMLTLSDDFKTSFALGTYIYLANSTNGSVVRSTGFEVMQIFTNGGRTFNISQINPNIGLYDYRYVIILCKPASVTFGYADLN
jgi:hypothetical protein